MLGKKVRFDGYLYVVIYDYKNDMIEICKKEDQHRHEVKLVKKNEIELVKEND